MTDSVLNSTKSCKGEGSREGKEKEMRKAVLRIERFDIGGLVRNRCFTKFKSWKIKSEELKKSMVGELSVHWDVDETDEKQRKYLDDLFKMHFRQLQFNV
ncbi:hypothetical protein D8674_010127 [Pyrus ussuriensis x Pyrus communis]|uniref:Uncharacterized protein n=1 Tax=Pyrus ussuriensis x Pyrus communis TaxID=2448454 RepID=A0A5N5F9V8_9ROSA|nr:hypothetical protein D8674_010127 [Pyrus ussuriensis x Pyrus communis]